MMKLQSFGHLVGRANHWQRPWCWERLKAGGEGDDRGWDGWMASLARWTQVWVSSGRWWRTKEPGVLQSMGLQRVGHDWATELQQQAGQSKKREADKQNYLCMIKISNAEGVKRQSQSLLISNVSHTMFLYLCWIARFIFFILFFLYFKMC